MVFAPHSHGGVGLCHLYHEHGAQQIITLLRHLRAGTPLGKTLEILIRQYQLWSGFQHHILEDPKKCPWISDHWLSYLRTIMSTQNLSIRYASWTIKPLREHDRYLMEDILQHGLPKHQLEKINACRMYLKVTTLAEITDNTGEALLPQVLTDFHHPIPKGLLNISQSLLKWPTIHLPTAHCWRLWTRTLGTIYTGSPTGTRLIQKLGSWTTHHNDQRFWHWRLHDPDHLVFKSAPSAPTRLAIPVTIRRHTAKFLPTIPTTIPFSGPPVTPHDPNIGHVPLPIAAVNPAPSSRQPEHFATIQKQFRHQLSPWQRPLFGSLRKSHPTNTLYQRLHDKRTLTVVSDASVQKNGHSGFAWIIADDADPLWRGQGLAPGPEDDIHSGRAEAMGLLAALIFLRYYISCYEPLQPTDVICYCDNAGVITNTNSTQDGQPPRPNDTTTNDRDLYVALADIVQQCQPLLLQFQHVQGHQDVKQRHRPLTLAEAYNVECDKRAKEYALASPINSTTLGNPEIEAAAPHLYIDGKLICRQYLPALREAAALPAYCDYLQQKLKWTRKEVNVIHWRALRYAINGIKPNDQRRIVLILNNKLPLRASKAHPHPGSKLCPSCQREDETSEHFFICQHRDRKEAFTQLKSNLTKLTIQHQLHPSVFTSLWLGLTATRMKMPYPDIIPDLPQELRPAVKDQTRIGWEQLYKGRVTYQWAHAIDLLHPGLPLSGCTVIVKILTTVWTYLLQIWQIRNQHLHNDAGKLSLPDYRQAVQTMFDQRHQLPPAAQEAVFNRPIEQILALPPAAIREWIIRSQKYIQQQLRAAKTRAKIRTQDIRSFFHIAHSSDNDLQPP